MVDAETFEKVLVLKPGVARTHLVPAGSSLRADGDPARDELEVEFTPSATDDDVARVRETARQNEWQVNTEWGTHVWLLERRPE